DRDYHDGAKQEVAPHPAYGVEAHVPDVEHEALDAWDDVPRVQPERREHDADQDRHQDEAHQHREGRAAEEAGDCVVGHEWSPNPESLADPNMRPAPSSRAPDGPAAWAAVGRSMIYKGSRREFEWCVPILGGDT